MFENNSAVASKNRCDTSVPNTCSQCARRSGIKKRTAERLRVICPERSQNSAAFASRSAARKCLHISPMLWNRVLAACRKHNLTNIAFHLKATRLGALDEAAARSSAGGMAGSLAEPMPVIARGSRGASRRAEDKAIQSQAHRGHNDQLEAGMTWKDNRYVHEQGWGGLTRRPSPEFGRRNACQGLHGPRGSEGGADKS
jgi:hypothetical protein